MHSSLWVGPDYYRLYCKDHKIVTERRLKKFAQCYSKDMNEWYLFYWNLLVGPSVLKDVFAGSNVSYPFFPSIIQICNWLHCFLVLPADMPGIFDWMLGIGCWWNKNSYFKPRQEKFKDETYPLPLGFSLPFSVHCGPALCINQTSPMAEMPAQP